MCTPTIIFIASAAFSAYGTYRQGQAQAQAANYQARVNENNAAAAKEQMKSVAHKEEIDKSNIQRRAAKLRATGRVGFAAAGVELGSGSPLDWELNMTEQEQLDLMSVEYNADLEKAALQNQAGNYQSQANINRMTAKEARTAGLIGTGASLLNSYDTYTTRFGG